MFPEDSIETVQLEATKYALRQHIEQRALEHVTDPKVYIEHQTKQIVVQLEAVIYGSRLDTYEEHLEVPDDWWSHFKVWARRQNKWWLRWVRRCKAPRMKVYRFEVEGRLLFPDIPVDMRRQQRSIVYRTAKLSPLAPFE